MFFKSKLYFFQTVAYLRYPAPGHNKFSFGAPTQPVLGSINAKYELGVKGRRKLTRVLHIFVLLRSEIPSAICAKLRTVAASNNRVHMP